MRCLIPDGRKVIRAGLLFVLAPVMFMVACSGPSHTLKTPDRESFYANVVSPDLRAAFDDSLVAPGMPFFVIDQIFAEWDNVTAKKVASIGSRQELLEKEGSFFVSQDPHIKTWVKEFKTDHGTVSVWYDDLNFYNAFVHVGDTLVVFWNDSMLISPIRCLLDWDSLSIADSLPSISVDTFFTVEIRQNNNIGRPVSHWYRVIAIDPNTVQLQPTGFDLYPIERIELDGDSVETLPWRIKK